MDHSPSRSVDHLVYATPALAETVADLESRFGLAATPGGQHPGRGTRNALFGLGSRCYLEVIGPDWEQPSPSSPRWLGIDSLDRPRMVAWAVATSNLDEVAARAQRNQIRLGPVVEGGRRRPDGIQLRWRATDPAVVAGDGLVPFFMDWLDSPHPSDTTPQGCTLVDFRAEHPHPDDIRRMLHSLGLALEIRTGPRAALIATLETPRGRVELR